MMFEEQKRRYENDPLFHAYVDILYSMLMEGRVTVGELRDAVTFAGLKFEMGRVRPCFPGQTILWDEGGFYGGGGFREDRHCGNEERKSTDASGRSGRVAIIKRPLLADQAHQRKDSGKADESG